MFIIVLLIVINSISIIEYCATERFNPTCTSNQVIHVSQAVYGRMAIGKCLKKNLLLGCSVNVLGVMDRLCSGKTACDVPIFNSEIGEHAHCLDHGITGYLEAAFYCQKGNFFINRFDVTISNTFSEKIISYLKKLNAS